MNRLAKIHGTGFELPDENARAMLFPLDGALAGTSVMPVTQVAPVLQLFTPAATPGPQDPSSSSTDQHAANSAQLSTPGAVPASAAPILQHLVVAASTKPSTRSAGIKTAKQNKAPSKGTPNIRRVMMHC